MGRVVQAIGDILYELQPVRPKDLKKWSGDVVGGTIKLGGQLARGAVFLVRGLVSFVVGLSLRSVMATLGWVLALRWVYSSYPDWTQLYVVLSILVSMFVFGLDSSGNRTSASAYSVFNRNFEAIAGTMTREDVDRAMRGGL